MGLHNLAELHLQSCKRLVQLPLHGLTSLTALTKLDLCRYVQTAMY